MTRTFRDQIDRQVDFVLERGDMPHHIYISSDVMRAMLIECDIHPPADVVAPTNITYRSAAGTIPITVVREEREYVMVEGYLEHLVEKELLSED